MDIQNDSTHRRFKTLVDGGEAHILYHRGPQNSYDLFATEVPPESRGKNIADQLVREAIKVAKSENVQIIATCPYVKHWFDKHPEEKEILQRNEIRGLER
ncbi:GNAT family N-acetyltransferase [Bdellovibrio sp. 22V]|uniref:GNAT family N-acetyltransferase n=1 Tax=Bdellovibrio TaxID=958 RepID=UPI0025433575|nr:GNAT family N-acetyltransferase [Bdellovibrio sp. 22V]WII72130.1 GNAT family N-acetyltransferase [Bdellovibrio sp. 22V]